MMRYVVFALLIFAALIMAPLVANHLMEDNGYVLIRFMNWTLESSVPALVVMLVVFYVVVRLIGALLRGTFGIGKATSEVRRRMARKRTHEGLTQISAGNLQQGERALVRAAPLSDAPLVNYLGAARAAQLQGAYDRRDRWLQLASQESDDNASAVLLTQAELQMENGQHEAALASLRKLEETAPGNAKGLSLLAHLYAELGEWRQLGELMPRLQKNPGVSAETLADWSQRSYEAVFTEAGASGKTGSVHAAWNQMPRAMRKKPEIAAAYVKSLAATGDSAAAAAVIVKQLKRAWNADLVTEYGQLELEDTSAQLAQCETWLKARAKDPALLLAAARLAIRAKLWGKARSYLESAIEVEPSVEGYDAYGRLLEELGETSLASEAFRNGLTLATGSSTEIVAVTENPADEDASAESKGAES
ncbi:MAG: heme biosynthesis HemY N-terminal domain-containing protein [Pseudomonadota bacterium]